jgi:hypothetical protein
MLSTPKSNDSNVPHFPTPRHSYSDNPPISQGWIDRSILLGSNKSNLVNSENRIASDRTNSRQDNNRLICISLYAYVLHRERCHYTVSLLKFTIPKKSSSMFLFPQLERRCIPPIQVRNNMINLLWVVWCSAPAQRYPNSRGSSHLLRRLIHPCWILRISGTSRANP